MIKINIIVTCLILVITQAVSAQTLTTQKKNSIVDQLENIIVNQYVLTENIPSIQEALLNLRKSNAYKLAATEQELSTLLGKTIREFDGHFSVFLQESPSKESNTPPREGWFNMLTRKNSGFNKVEILKGNIGYIEFIGFDDVNEKSKGIVESALRFVESTDALIFDLRKNGGGSPVMIQLISSHFFKEKTHLNSFYSRRTGQLTDFWTFKKINGLKRPKVPIYILTSNYTFSAAEEFSYNLKHLKRASIIGEATGGGANPVHYFDLIDSFKASIPVSKAVNPITKTNWESIGVQPDKVVESEKAFDIAYEIALNVTKEKTTNKFQLKEINEQLALLQKSK